MDSQNIPLDVGTTDNSRKFEVSLPIVYKKLCLTLALGNRILIFLRAMMMNLLYHFIHPVPFVKMIQFPLFLPAKPMAMAYSYLMDSVGRFVIFHKVA